MEEVLELDPKAWMLSEEKMKAELHCITVLLSSKNWTTYSIPVLFDLLCLGCVSRNDREGSAYHFKSYKNKEKRMAACLLQLINSFSKVAGYKINSQKSLALHKWQVELEIRETLFTVASNNKNILE